MQRTTVIGAKIAIVVILLVSLAIQIFMIPTLAAETAAETAADYPEFAVLEIPGVIGLISMILCGQVVLVAVWKLLTLVARSKIFDEASFTWVNLIIAAFIAFGALVLGAGLLLFAAGAMHPSFLIGLLTLFVAAVGATLVVVVMKELLLRAVALEHDMSEVV